ncbi:hypothetical protein K493DRAFT_314949 [Basidiobolus meristosporus CBS 931.73]|uniref:Uncharacterized protein n=1 Tax=Basidiobolus meristosporus CBS 931.73 TaxID=1314790 RepID=A0A1Y1YCC4_9FUNG|nr:hypothetical protein K493DRAFT_314949 [Basidiobolus meristosporus CBS 931.73]|eukprot:ORX95593.1 hypothetical protein K493DRAFT_314949 [Basidiobolus meristosporus CBS 931.73]
MLFQKSHLNANTVRPLVTRSTRQNSSRPTINTPVKQFGTTSNGPNAYSSTMLGSVLQRFRGSLMGRNPSTGISRLNNETRSRFHTATAESFYPLPSNNLFGEFFRPNSPSYYGSTTNPTLTTYNLQPQQSEPEAPWEDFTLYDDDGAAGEFSWDVASFAPALFAPLAEVIASTISNSNESNKPADNEQEQGSEDPDKFFERL